MKSRRLVMRNSPARPVAERFGMETSTLVGGPALWNHAVLITAGMCALAHRLSRCAAAPRQLSEVKQKSFGTGFKTSRLTQSSHLPQIDSSSLRQRPRRSAEFLVHTSGRPTSATAPQKDEYDSWK